MLETARLNSIKLYNTVIAPEERIAQEELSVTQKDLCNTVKCQLCINLPEAELCDAARATQRVNARSPLVDSKGQWALLTDKEAVGSCSRTPIATVQVLCATPRAEDSEAGHLLELVRLQAVTRREAKEATQGESPLVDETAEGLLDLILQP
jgi:hypothetical protein